MAWAYAHIRAYVFWPIPMKFCMDDGTLEDHYLSIVYEKSYVWYYDA